MSSGSQIFTLISKHWRLNCSTFALQSSSELWTKATLFKVLPITSDLSCSDLLRPFLKARHIWTITTTSLRQNQSCKWNTPTKLHQGPVVQNSQLLNNHIYLVDRSCPLDRWFIQWTTVSTVLNNRAQYASGQRLNNNIYGIHQRSYIRARLFKTVDKVIHWIIHLSSGQLLSTG
jgi:hypothetical protein